jgi:NTE family protein
MSAALSMTWRTEWTHSMSMPEDQRKGDDQAQVVLFDVSHQQPIRMPGRSPTRRNKQVSLGLQGGGSFGAFTWGVLDRLLEYEGLGFDIVSGASAGAMNAVVLASGLADGGQTEARRRLDRFWRRLGTGATVLPPVMAALEMSAHLISPYQSNPLGLNPLRNLISEEVDFERLRTASPIRLLIAATRVKDGGLRLFREDQVTIEVVLASACLPLLHHAVEIDGETYWDGGFSANPPLRQLALDTRARDILLVQIMPEVQEKAPHLSVEISRRASAIAFNASLHRELQALDDLREGCSGTLALSSRLCRKLRRIRLHRISAPDTVDGLDHESMLDTSLPFLERLKQNGREAAEQWMTNNKLFSAE